MDQSRIGKRLRIWDLWRLVIATVGVIAIIQELRKPRMERSWHGKVGNFVPYDFRMPTIARIREAYWNPDGPFMSSKAWGVGWAPNLAAVKDLFR